MKHYIIKLICKIWDKTFSEFVMSKYPWMVTTQVDKFKTIYVKKGKIREWRTYNSSGERVPLIK